MRAAVLAVDGGNSKTDVALVGADGRLLGAVRGPTVSHQAIGLDRGMAELVRLVALAAGTAALGASAADLDTDGGGPISELGVYCLAGADFISDVRLLERGVAGRFAREDVVLNDCFAALRAGAEKGWGVVLICGQGINGAGVAPDGRTARFAGIGTLSGDWGGGDALGTAALAAAIRAGDRRGPKTSLRRSVADHFGKRTPEAVMRAMYEGSISSGRLSELSPAVFGEAQAGDAVARGIIDRLADELAVMAVALIRRLRLAREEVDVVLAGGVFGTRDEVFYRRLEHPVRLVAPRARFVTPGAPPVLGAALIGLDRLASVDRLAPDGLADAAARLREQLIDWDPKGVRATAT